MMTKRSKKSTVLYELKQSGEICVAFVNTVATRRDNRNLEPTPRSITAPIATYQDLVAWGLRLGVLTAGQAQGLNRRAAERPEDAAVVLAQALELREALRRIFLDLVFMKPPAQEPLTVVNTVRNAIPQRSVVVQGDVYGLETPDGSEHLERMLWPVVTTAADLLTTERRRRIGRCANRDCTWIFIDGNARRLWCDPKICGSRLRGKDFRRKNGNVRYTLV